MNVRLVILLTGSLLVAAAGGLIAAIPVIRASAVARPPVERAPSPELEVRRQAMMASLRSTADAIADRALHLELLAALMADAARRSQSAAEAGRSPDRQRISDHAPAMVPRVTAPVAMNSMP